MQLKKNFLKFYFHDLDLFLVFVQFSSRYLLLYAICQHVIEVQFLKEHLWKVLNSLMPDLTEERKTHFLYQLSYISTTNTYLSYSWTTKQDFYAFQSVLNLVHSIKGYIQPLMGPDSFWYWQKAKSGVLSLGTLDSLIVEEFQIKM